MLFHPELDRYAQHPRTWPSVRALLGGDACQWVQLDFRESPAGAARGCQCLRVPPQMLRRGRIEAIAGEFGA